MRLAKSEFLRVEWISEPAGEANERGRRLKLRRVHLMICLLRAEGADEE
jgi:hypothetical protein